MLRYTFLHALLAFIAFSGVGCSGVGAGPTVTPRPTLRAIGPHIQVLPGEAGPPGSEPRDEILFPGEAGTTGSLTLRDALALMLKENPELDAQARELAALEGEVLQAGLLPNPELELEIEGVLGGTAVIDEDGSEATQDLGGFDQGEGTAFLSQTIELGGKRLARRRLAQSESLLAAWDHEALRVRLISETRSAFVDALAAQELVDLAESLLDTAERSVAAVSARLDAGKISPLELQRSQLEKESLRARKQQADLLSRTARARLAALWGGSEADFGELSGEPEAIADLPELDTLRERLENNPELARRESELELRRATLGLERSKAWPDLAVGAGARYLRESDNHAFLFGLSIPLPFFDRNQGSIQAAEERLKAADSETTAIRRRLDSRVLARHGELAALLSTIRILEKRVVPESRSIHEKTLEGYRLGKFELLDVLDAQHAYYRARSDYLQSVVEYQKTLVDLELLIGESLTTDAVILEPDKHEERVP